jgi:hypothetical protein
LEDTVARWWSRPAVKNAAGVVTGVVFLGAIVMPILARDPGGVAYVVAALAWAPLGLFLWSRRPENAIGPLITLTGMTSYLTTIGFNMGTVIVFVDTDLKPIPWLATLALASTGPGTYLILIAILHFPDGRLPSPGWRWVNRVFVLLTAAIIVAALFATPGPGLPNPWVGAATAQAARDLVFDLIYLFGLGLIAVLISLIVRYRRADQVGRRQLKWLIFVMVIYVIFTIITFGFIGFEGFNLLGAILDGLMISLLPAAMAVAIIRYRLFEIDRIVSRTVSYALLVIVIAAVYAVPVILLPTVLGESSDLVVAGATLSAAAVFNPTRRWIQDRIDRRFNRSRYNTVREIEGLAARLNSSPDSRAPIDETLGFVSRVLEPASLGLWIRATAADLPTGR